MQQFSQFAEFAESYNTLIWEAYDNFCDVFPEHFLWNASIEWGSLWLLIVMLVVLAIWNDPEKRLRTPFPVIIRIVLIPVFDYLLIPGTNLISYLSGFLRDHLIHNADWLVDPRIRPRRVAWTLSEKNIYAKYENLKFDHREANETSSANRATIDDLRNGLQDSQETVRKLQAEILDSRNASENKDLSIKTYVAIIKQMKSDAGQEVNRRAAEFQKEEQSLKATIDALNHRLTMERGDLVAKLKRELTEAEHTSVQEWKELNVTKERLETVATHRDQLRKELRATLITLKMHEQLKKNLHDLKQSQLHTLQTFRRSRSKSWKNPQQRMAEHVIPMLLADLLPSLQPPPALSVPAPVPAPAIAPQGTETLPQATSRTPRVPSSWPRSTVTAPQTNVVASQANASESQATIPVPDLKSRAQTPASSPAPTLSQTLPISQTTLPAATTTSSTSQASHTSLTTPGKLQDPRVPKPVQGPITADQYIRTFLVQRDPNYGHCLDPPMGVEYNVFVTYKGLVDYAFEKTFPDGFNVMDTPPDEMKCAFHALILSAQQQLPGVQFPNLDHLERLFRRSFPGEQASDLTEIQTAKVLYEVGKEIGVSMDLGIVQDDEEGEEGYNCRMVRAEDHPMEYYLTIWIHHNGVGHWSGLDPIQIPAASQPVTEPSTPATATSASDILYNQICDDFAKVFPYWQVTFPDTGVDGVETIPTPAATSGLSALLSSALAQFQSGFAIDANFVESALGTIVPAERAANHTCQDLAEILFLWGQNQDPPQFLQLGARLAEKCGQEGIEAPNCLTICCAQYHAGAEGRYRTLWVNHENREADGKSYNHWSGLTKKQPSPMPKMSKSVSFAPLPASSRLKDDSNQHKRISSSEYATATTSTIAVNQQTGTLEDAIVTATSIEAEQGTPSQILVATFQTLNLRDTAVTPSEQEQFNSLRQTTNNTAVTPIEREREQTPPMETIMTIPSARSTLQTIGDTADPLPAQGPTGTTSIVTPVSSLHQSNSMEGVASSVRQSVDGIDSQAVPRIPKLPSEPTDTSMSDARPSSESPPRVHMVPEPTITGFPRSTGSQKMISAVQSHVVEMTDSPEVDLCDNSSRVALTSNESGRSPTLLGPLAGVNDIEMQKSPPENQAASLRPTDRSPIGLGIGLNILPRTLDSNNFGSPPSHPDTNPARKRRTHPAGLSPADDASVSSAGSSELGGAPEGNRAGDMDVQSSYRPPHEMKALPTQPSVGLFQVQHEQYTSYNPRHKYDEPGEEVTGEEEVIETISEEDSLEYGERSSEDNRNTGESGERRESGDTEEMLGCDEMNSDEEPAHLSPESDNESANDDEIDDRDSYIEEAEDADDQLARQLSIEMQNLHQELLMPSSNIDPSDREVAASLSPSSPSHHQSNVWNNAPPMYADPNSTDNRSTSAEVDESSSANNNNDSSEIAESTESKSHSSSSPKSEGTLLAEAQERYDELVKLERQRETLRTFIDDRQAEIDARPDQTNDRRRIRMTSRRTCSKRLNDYLNLQRRNRAAAGDDVDGIHYSEPEMEDPMQELWLKIDEMSEEKLMAVVDKNEVENRRGSDDLNAQYELLKNAGTATQGLGDQTGASAGASGGSGTDPPTHGLASLTGITGTSRTPTPAEEPSEDEQEDDSEGERSKRRCRRAD